MTKINTAMFLLTDDFKPKRSENKDWCRMYPTLTDFFNVVADQSA